MLKSVVITTNVISKKPKPLSEDLNELFERLCEEGVSDNDIIVHFQVTASDNLKHVFETALVIWRDDSLRAV